MQLHMVLIVFSLNIYKSSTETSANINLYKNFAQKIPTDGRDIDDTPSLEWIKYQQERFQNTDKLFNIKQATIKTIHEPQYEKQAIPAGMLNKFETTSTQKTPAHVAVEQTEFQIKKNIMNGQDTYTHETTSAVEFPSIKGFLEFIKSLKRNWEQNSLFRIDDKIKMLHQLKDSLLKTIENQFMILWQDDDANLDDNKNKDGSRSRSKRGILDESNINFPPDAALMSINFLTFAVFLIKLVLQVVNIVKTKHYQFSTFSMDTGAIRNG